MITDQEIDDAYDKLIAEELDQRLEITYPPDTKHHSTACSDGIGPYIGYCHICGHSPKRPGDRH